MEEAFLAWGNLRGIQWGKASEGRIDSMSGRHSWSELTKNFSTEMRRLVDDAKGEMQAEAVHHELRLTRSQRDMQRRINDDENTSAWPP